MGYSKLLKVLLMLSAGTETLHVTLVVSRTQRAPKAFPKLFFRRRNQTSTSAEIRNSAESAKDAKETFSMATLVHWLIFQPLVLPVKAHESSYVLAPPWLIAGK